MLLKLPNPAVSNRRKIACLYETNRPVFPYVPTSLLPDWKVMDDVDSKKIYETRKECSRFIKDPELCHAGDANE